MSSDYEQDAQTDWVHLTSYENLPGCPRPPVVLFA